jgi:hypothetical protein
MGGQSHWALPPGKKSPAMVEQFVRTNSPRAQSNKVGSASNTIPCFPTSNGTDVHHCDTKSHRSLPSQFIEDSSVLCLDIDLFQNHQGCESRRLCHGFITNICAVMSCPSWYNLPAPLA